ncbi:uncharacterized protein LOC132038477 [Lycium ferocissimum]|uniref:uncharacterized protein LOC132038477 n=1 Tax=Lycium ferocissimum TaxID=112874 RepID=UPI002815ED0A|nr:uncharacterized protein LOC132038477 [Lycium ferocissimum]
MKRFFSLVSSKLPQSSSSATNAPQVEENLNQLEENHHSAKKQKQRVDLDSLSADPKKRIHILDYLPDELDEIRRAYIQRRPHQPQLPMFLKQILMDESIHQGGGEAFSSIGFKSWHKKKRLDTHVGELNSDHNQAKKKCEDLMRQEQSIQVVFVNPDNKTKLEHRIRSKASIEVVRLFLNQGLAFRGHHEDESSLNKDKFLEILSWYAKRCDKIGDLVLKMAPRNDQLTSHKIQKDIITSCKLETIKVTMEDLNGNYFSLLVDESCDVSCKEKMAIVLRYVDRWGSVVEWFIGIVHVRDTSALCLKEAIVNCLAQHSLSLSHIHGQCYDGASNMQGLLSGHKTLIQQESRSAHAIHCFSHQLQLTLVEVSKKCLQVEELVLSVSNVLNAVRGSFKRMDELRESQAEKVQEALDMVEVATGKGLNQELGLAKAANTRWDILAITNELNESLQKKEQDIANAMLLVQVVKKRLQDLRDEGWDPLIENLSAFCVKYDILIPNFDEFYVNFGRSRRRVADYTFSHHYRVDIFCKITGNFKHSMNVLTSFDIKKILRMAELYPDDFGENIMVTLKNELETYIVDVRDVDGRFSNLKGLGNLTEELVKTKKHLNYPLVFGLVKFVLLLPVATATIERAFSAMKLIKSELRNRMDDDFMSSYIVPYAEKRIFNTDSDESIMNRGSAPTVIQHPSSAPGAEASTREIATIRRITYSANSSGVKDIEAEKERLPEKAKPSMVDVLRENISFHQGMKLNYYPLILKEEVKVAKLNVSEIDTEIEKWNHSLVGYVIGGNPLFKEMLKFAYGVRKFVTTPQVFLHTDGYFIFCFENEEDKCEVLEKAPYTYNNRTVILRNWVTDFELQRNHPEFCQFGYLFRVSQLCLQIDRQVT